MLLSLPALASPEVRRNGEARDFDIILGAPSIDDRQLVPDAPQVPGGTAAGTGPGTSALAQSRVIYLNRNGVTLTPGTNDSRANRSTLATQQTVIPAWNASTATWSATVACMRELFAPFAVTIVETDRRR